MGTEEAERFEEDLDSTEYHDATEEPIRKEEPEESQILLKPGGILGDFGSSSLKECIELLNAIVRNSRAPLDSGVGQNTTVPSQKNQCVSSCRFLSLIFHGKWETDFYHYWC